MKETKFYNPYLYKSSVHIPNWLMEIPCHEISNSAKLIYGKLLLCCDSDGVSPYNIGATTLKQNLGMPQSMIELGLRELLVVNLIDIEDRGVIRTLNVEDLIPNTE